MSARPWRWVPSLYFAEAVPYVIVMTVSVILYKRLGVDNSTIAFATSWLYLPWVVKPLWSPFVDLFGTKRRWITGMQLPLGVALALVAFALPLPGAFPLTLAVFWLMAFLSATHDIAADGFYLLALDEGSQAAFVGVRSTFYRIAMIAAQGALVWFAGQIETAGLLGREAADIRLAWGLSFGLLSALFLGLFLWHRFALPRPAADVPGRRRPAREVLREFGAVFVRFFAKPRIAVVIAFLLLYRFSEAQLVKMVSPFLLDPRADGGLGLSTKEVGLAYGTVGLGALMAGGILGGWAISRRGLRFWLWPMVLALNVPNLLYLWLAHAPPDRFLVVCASVAAEQFGYGFGFTAYVMFMILVSEGEHRTAHYALCTGFMALGMMLPGMWSGSLEERIGYPHFFLWVAASAIPCLLVTTLVRIPRGFGRKGELREREQ
ncbi:MAG: MFS transporter [Planctomycetes bacterium]|nr:MFS transporter [Planctomycetota bacterium]